MGGGALSPSLQIHWPLPTGDWPLSCVSQWLIRICFRAPGSWDASHSYKGNFFWERKGWPFFGTLSILLIWRFFICKGCRVLDKLSA